MQAGAKINEDGVILHDGGVASFRRDVGGRFVLDLRRIGGITSGHRVRVLGTYVGDDIIDVDDIHAL